MSLLYCHKFSLPTHSQARWNIFKSSGDKPMIFGGRNPRGARGAIAPPDFGRSVKTLSQPREVDYAHKIILASPDLRPSYGPV